MNLIRLLCIAGTGLLAACSHYGSRWEAARGAKGDVFEGAYAGRWQSARHAGAGGRLRCILKKTGPRKYAAEFRATWHGVFASEHLAKLTVTERSRGREDVAVFRGGAEINMWIGSGRYQCEGGRTGPVWNSGVRALKVPGRLRATYDAAYDSGSFDLERVGAKGKD